MRSALSVTIALFCLTIVLFSNIHVEGVGLSYTNIFTQNKVNLSYSSKGKAQKKIAPTYFLADLQSSDVNFNTFTNPSVLSGSVGYNFGDVFSKKEVLDDKGINNSIRQMSIDSPDRKLVYVNISRQQYTALENGEIVRQTRITTGRSGFPTITGKFKVREKVYKKTLRAPSPAYGDYELDVDYWMPFHQAYGFHDAWWRSSFGGSDYVYNGSHGCVNMQKADVKWMFGWANVGTDVYVSY
ncbi:MAG: hypothetical protein OHK0017_04200 [Patescibacteria group bacterium]